MIHILSQRNGKGRRDERGENEREEGKKRKMSERMINRKTRDSHNENTAVILMERSSKALSRALMVAMIQ
jgi:hypothetical protein